jgi:hypothetical protein
MESSKPPTTRWPHIVRTEILCFGLTKRLPARPVRSVTRVLTYWNSGVYCKPRPLSDVARKPITTTITLDGSSRLIETGEEKMPKSYRSLSLKDGMDQTS